MSLRPIVLVWLYFVFTVFVLISSSKEFCNLNFKVEHNLYNDGFHRNLSYVIDFSSPKHDSSWFDDGQCDIAMEQTLPAGVYASPDEVRNYRNDYFFSILFRNPVDVELSANDASPIIMHLVLNAIDNKILFSLPVHARYHPAVAGGGTARNRIASPIMYINCRDKRHMCERNNKETISINNLCPKGINPEMCAWQVIPINVVTGPIVWDTPVGNTDHYYVVAGGTALVIIFWSLYLLKTIHQFKLDSMKTSKKMK